MAVIFLPYGAIDYRAIVEVEVEVEVEDIYIIFFNKKL